MTPRLALALLAGWALFATGCGHGTTVYRPTRLAPGELTLRYDDAFEVWSPKAQVAAGPSFGGLADFVRCVPEAKSHADAAEAYGSGSMVLSGFSIGLSVVGLGGLSGLYFKDRDESAMAGLLVGAVVVEAVAIALGAGSLGAKAHANGHALDAVNYYNDALGSSGGDCRER